MIYRFDAEHISRKIANELVLELGKSGYSVEYATVDSPFMDQLLMFVTADKAGAEKIRNRIWELNSGLHCEMREVCIEQLEAYTTD